MDSLSSPAVESKRHSLSAPRPLHLLDSSNVNILSPHASRSPSFATPDNSNTKKINRHHPQRQSSISYYSKDSHTSSPFTPRHALSRSVSLGSSSPHKAVVNGDRKSTGSLASEILERPPLTLAEKHADLLHFIAQKEAKCLDLRSQLTLHEGELLQLKRKWERIVSRGFQKGDGSNDFTSNPGSANSVVLEGIKEGVQGVSRYIAAGLSSNPSPPMRLSSAPKRGHAPQQSTSSASTTTTDTKSSARLSQSSASSFGDEGLLSPKEEEEDRELIVCDTGATPTVSPNPAFKFQKKKQNMELDDQSGNENESATMRRHRSQDVFLDSEKFSSPSVESPKAALCEKQTPKPMKRASIAGLPPMASIPGLGSISMSGHSPQPMSSWVGSATKKWEELQRGSSFTMSHKRASTLLSDVSQSIVSALSSPQSLTAPAFFTPPLPSPGKPSPSSSSTVSLLDIDDPADTYSTTHLGSVMKPDSTSTSNAQSTTSTSALKIGDKIIQDEGDDEWNW